MYKVFLADDESAMRSGVRNNIDWDKSNLSFSGEAADGEMALSLMQDIMPDILITDVRMPFMDGIELSKIVRQTMPWVKIIILSGHDEFEYAKQAISIGVEEYLLKPVTSETLLNTLKAVAVRIDEEKENLKNLEELINHAKKHQIERLLLDLLYENITVEKALPLAKELDLEIRSDKYQILLIELKTGETESASLDTALLYICDVLDNWGHNNYFSRGPDNMVCVLHGSDPSDLEEDAYACAKAIKYAVKRNLSIKTSVFVGSVVSEISRWSDSLAAAEKVKKTLSKSIENAEYSDVVYKALNYINANFSQRDVSLQTVAQEVCISPNHFSAVFKQEVGETFINYLTKVRMDHAKMLLETTKLRTADICYATGYNDTHYFSYVFNKNVGRSPREYRSSLNGS